MASEGLQTLAYLGLAILAWVVMLVVICKVYKE